jgi:hypothetical protein
VLQHALGLGEAGLRGDRRPRTRAPSPPRTASGSGSSATRPGRGTGCSPRTGPRPRFSERGRGSPLRHPRLALLIGRGRWLAASRRGQ